MGIKSAEGFETCKSLSGSDNRSHSHISLPKTNFRISISTIFPFNSRYKDSNLVHSTNPSSDSCLRKAYLHASTVFILFLILYSDTVSAIDEINEEVDRNYNSCEIVQPYILDNRGYLEPLLVKRCPRNLVLALVNSQGQEYVIELCRNDHLISERYSKGYNDKSTDEMENTKHQPSSHSNDRSPKDDQEFHQNNKYISMENFKRNDELCHYHGTVNDDESSISAISIVDSRHLSGVFQSGSFSYHLITNLENRTTTLVKVKSNQNFLDKQKLQFCLDNPKFTKHLHTHHHERSRRSAQSISSYDSMTNRPKLKRKRKSSLENKVLHGPYQKNSNSLFVELLVVHDHNQCKEYQGNTSLIVERTMQIVNIMNAFYRQLNIFVTLVGVVLWTNEDEIQLTEDGDSTLTNFLKYRHEKLLPRYPHDSAQLITSTSFNGSVVGKALKGPICTHDHSGGVNTDHSHSPAIVAVTLAHELGHNLGMEHDEDDKCSCPDEKCIMSSSSSLVHPKHWSSCSIDYLEDSRKHGLLDCLKDEPEQIFGPICGNGFVEEGEDCDIGVAMPSYGTSKSRTRSDKIVNTRLSSDIGSLSSMNNPCCDRSTCRFVANATCAQGPCCDLARCAVFNGTQTKVCRPKKNECDFEEICDGTSEFCPQDVHYHDGVQCGPTTTLSSNDDERAPIIIGSAAYNRSVSYCYQGHCASHESQCQLLWGGAASTSRDICYDQNVHGNTSGNCGYNRKEKIYEVCEAEDALCGMLHCVHNQPSSTDSTRKTGKLSYGFESASILTVSFFVMNNQDRIYCHGAIIDAGPNIRDPGLVPNGASCGEDKMCSDQKCVPVADIVSKNWCPSDCNGNGICDNLGVCHCNDGTIGTSCYQFFSSNFHISLILYITMFFGPIIALIVLAANHYRKRIKIWWFLHNRMIALRNKAREPGRHQPMNMQNRRAMAYQAKGHQISISEPIQLKQQIGNQQTNSDAQSSTNNPDPWAETSTCVAQTPTATLISALSTPTNQPSTAAATFGFAKSPGYRLEPLQKEPLEPLPPPVPPHRQQINTFDRKEEGSISRPVRAAPPPPPHAHRKI